MLLNDLLLVAKAIICRKLFVVAGQICCDLKVFYGCKGLLLFRFIFSRLFYNDYWAFLGFERGLLDRPKDMVCVVRGWRLRFCGHIILLGVAVVML